MIWISASKLKEKKRWSLIQKENRFKLAGFVIASYVASANSAWQVCISSPLVYARVADTEKLRVLRILEELTGSQQVL